MLNKLSPDYFEACLASSISKEIKKAVNIEEIENLKLYSKAQICRDEAYKKPGYAEAIIKAGIDYGAYIELSEETYNAINREFKHTPDPDKLVAEKKEEYADLGLPKIEVYSLKNKNELPEIIMLGKFQSPIDFNAAKQEISKHIKNTLVI